MTRLAGIPGGTRTSTVESSELAFSADDKRVQKTLTHRGLAAMGACGMQHKVLARLTPGRVMRRQGESAMSAIRSIIHRCGNVRVVSVDHETPGQERSSSCRTRSDPRCVIWRCRKGGWRQPKRTSSARECPHRHVWMTKAALGQEHQ